MTNEEKQLLLQDLFSRLPYLVKVNYNNLTDYILDVKLMTTHFVEKMKPYLRPLSSMTDEEKNYVKNRWCYDDWSDIYDFLNNYTITAGDACDFIDWLNKKMFDYRGLIPMGIALPAPEGMYN